MLKIAICDDIKNMIQQMDLLLQKMSRSLDLQLVLFKYTKASSLLTDIHKGLQLDILVIDIQMDISGLEVARRLRQKFSALDLKILFMTAYEEQYYQKMFPLQISGCISKPISEIEVRILFENIFEQITRERNRGKLFAFQRKGVSVFVAYHEIIYFEVKSHIIYLACKHKNYSYYGSMTEVEAALESSDFLRVHESYIININSTRAFTSKKIVLCNGEIIPISQSRRQNVRNTLTQYFAIIKGGSNES